MRVLIMARARISEGVILISAGQHDLRHAGYVEKTGVFDSFFGT